TTRPLQPHEGLQVRLAFPKGLVTPPDLRQRITWWTRDHAGLLVALAGLLVLLTYCALRWRRTRRLQVPGAVPEHFEPPPGFSPAGLRYMRRMRHDARGFAADLLAGAVDEHLCIQRVAQGTRTGWRIERTREGAHALPTMEQRAQLSTLLPAPRDAVDLRSRNAARIAQACKAHGLALRRRFVPTLFRAHAGGIVGGLCIAVATAVPALMLARHTPVWWPTTLVLVSMLPVLVAFTLLVRVPTLEGRRLLAHAEGLRRHLAGAAKPARHHDGTAPTLDAMRYARLLPYAVALEVEDAWTKAFAASVGAPAAVAAVAGFSWYRGLVVTDLSRFSRSIGDSLTARISASARPKRAAPETPSSAP
ncbi:MAG: hypothetical protein ABW163_09875, partial [Luteimonas sp.]